MFKMDLDTLYSLSDYTTNKNKDIPLKHKQNIIKVFYSNTIFTFVNKFISNSLTIERINKLHKTNDYNSLFNSTKILSNNKFLDKNQLTIDSIIELYNTNNIQKFDFTNNEDEDFEDEEINNNGFDETKLDETKGQELLKRIEQLRKK